MSLRPFVVTHAADFLWKGTAILGCILAALVSAASQAGAPAGPRVSVMQTPDGGIQPQALTDADGTIHLLYFKGEAGGGDLFYARRDKGQERFSRPIRVNSEPGSAIAIGTIRGGQMALGKSGRVHVAWNGSRKATPKAPGDGTPMLYTRLNDAGTVFEPQRNLMHLGKYLDGGGTVAADSQGNVYVAWQALPVNSQPGEGNRKAFVARSQDEGKTFSQEAAVWAEPTGACGCCGMRAFADRKGNVYLFYRSAKDVVHRDMYLLVSKDQGKTFRQVVVHRWNGTLCPMSSEAFVQSGDAVVAAWETGKQIYYTRIDGNALTAAEPQAVPGPGGDRQHPALAVNAQGELAIAWAEGTGWQRGGRLVWQVFDRAGIPTVGNREANGIPVWGLPAVAALPDGSFLVLH